MARPEMMAPDGERIVPRSQWKDIHIEGQIDSDALVSTLADAIRLNRGGASVRLRAALGLED